MRWRRPIWRRYLECSRSWDYEDIRVRSTFWHGESLHSRELMTACSVGDLHGADCIVTADHFPEIRQSDQLQGPVSILLVRILDCWCVGLRKCALDKPVDKTGFAHSWRVMYWDDTDHWISLPTSGSEDDHSVVVAEFWHFILSFSCSLYIKKRKIFCSHILLSLKKTGAQYNWKDSLGILQIKGTGEHCTHNWCNSLWRIWVVSLCVVLLTDLAAWLLALPGPINQYQTILLGLDLPPPHHSPHRTGHTSHYHPAQAPGFITTFTLRILLEKSEVDLTRSSSCGRWRLLEVGERLGNVIRSHCKYADKYRYLFEGNLYSDK